MSVFNNHGLGYTKVSFLFIKNFPKYQYLNLYCASRFKKLKGSSTSAHMTAIFWVYLSHCYWSHIGNSCSNIGKGHSNICMAVPRYAQLLMTYMLVTNIGLHPRLYSWLTPDLHQRYTRLTPDCRFSMWEDSTKIMRWTISLILGFCLLKKRYAKLNLSRIIV